jgi:hypothetical protein
MSTIRETIFSQLQETYKDVRDNCTNQQFIDMKKIALVVIKFLAAAIMYYFFK